MVTWPVPWFSADLSYHGLALAGFDARQHLLTVCLPGVRLSDRPRTQHSMVGERPETRSGKHEGFIWRLVPMLDAWEREKRRGEKERGWREERPRFRVRFVLIRDRLLNGSRDTDWLPEVGQVRASTNIRTDFKIKGMSTTSELQAHHKPHI